MKILHLIATVALLFAATIPVSAQDDDYDEFTIRLSDIPRGAPRFASYPVPVYTGANAAPKLNADDRTRMYRTRIREWSREKPNFAGHYILATWGCGAECVQITIIDAMTGTVFHPDGVTLNAANNIEDALFDGKPRWPNAGSLKFKPDSQLLILFGMPEEDSKRRGISYYRWHNNKLSLLRHVPKAWYP
ncbi:hypothetical protein GJ700_30235 [Duganella sp. FT92W]|uniref:TonB C-terminal domain-containing protein n=1 Tax=Pseudoduganella rivuli TaxID=2666085 RepID=A0A7X2ITU4_9BURK|nr:hypothetical protein [Pseudoduganella rivuli]MRV76001.1 hypothetical protein [Pseudoduganella rivuli]